MSFISETPLGDLVGLLGLSKQRHQESVNDHPLRQDEYADIEQEKQTRRLQGLVTFLREDSDVLIVGWYNDEDKSNPRNWSRSKKIWVIFSICWCTFVVYCASAIIVPSDPWVQVHFGVSPEHAMLNLSMYVCGYGFGPLLFSPLSEIGYIGRNPPYVVSFLLFGVMSILLSTLGDKSFAGLIVMRFLQGFFGSPILASGGASLQDIYDWDTLPYAFIFYIGAIFCGPAFGPLLAAYAIPLDWRWPLWEIAIMVTPLLVCCALLPETSAEKILYLRAKRLRQQTGNDRYRSQMELAELEVRAIFNNAIIKPFEIAFLDPAIMFSCLYVALLYAIYYSFFASTGIVFIGTYGFTLGEFGLMWLSMVVGCVLFSTVYAVYIYFILGPQSRNEDVPYEERLKPSLVMVLLLPASLFMFAWTARAEVHWIVPTIAITLYSGTSFIVYQCLICYVPLSYPRYVASLLAAADFIRSMLAVGFVHFAGPLYSAVGIGKGVSILGAISILGVIGMWYLYLYGDRLRARSKFTGDRGS